MISTRSSSLVARDRKLLFVSTDLGIMAGFQYRTDRPVPELRKELEDLAATWPLADGAAGRRAVLPFCVVISRLSSSGLDRIGLDIL